MARLVFDLDGTLIDSAPDLHAVANALLAAEGCAPITLAEARGFVGQGVSVFVERMRAARNLPQSAQAPLLAAFLARYEGAVGLTRPYPGVVAALERLAGDHRLGICTNKPIAPTHAVLAHLGLDRYFESVFGGDSLAVRKPDPAPLVATLEGLGSGPALYIGDSEVDAETAAAAGVPFLLFTEGYRKGPVERMACAANFARFDVLPGLVPQVLADG